MEFLILQVTTMQLKKDRFIYSLIAAAIFTIVKILHKKIGGLLSGGLYSDSHSWSELTAMIPSFLLFFAVLFVLAYFVCFVLRMEIAASNHRLHWTAKVGRLRLLQSHHKTYFRRWPSSFCSP